ncbi:uncharacterized protein [Centruroides vittatus]|uniref:uncharacterized protein n=1 Tax=Centruroides vittatus TaxID=120091 RepID=UPI00350F3862
MCRVSSEFTFFILIFLVGIAVWNVDGNPLGDDVANVAETLRFLERLDSYYSKLARPRFGRSVNDKLKLTEVSRGRVTGGSLHDEVY